MTPNKWEIWYVDMPYEEGIGSKVRPALVIDPQRNFVVVGKMTSHSPRNNYPYEYPLQDWQGAGLPLPTTLRLSQRPKLAIGRFKKKIGQIRPVDLIQVRAMLRAILDEEMNKR